MTVELSKLNFRDLGGIPVQDGRRVRGGVLYRSEGPASFKAPHRDELAALGIRLVCDLRSDGERIAAPNDWCGSARLLNFGISNDLLSDKNEDWAALRRDRTEAAARKAMTNTYVTIPAAIHPHLASLVDAMLTGHTPVLVHCTAGKDRTGVAVAVLLRAVGASQDDVLADYLRSHIFATNMRRAGTVAKAFEKHFGFAPSEETLDLTLGVQPDYLEAALRAVEQNWGSIPAYFHTAGIAPSDVERLADLLLTDEA